MPEAELAAAREEIEAAGVGLVVLDRSSRLDLKPWLGAAASWRAWDIDVLHSHKFGSNVWGSVIGTACRVPVIVAHEHTWSYEGEPLRVWVDGHVIGRLADRLVAVSNADARRMVSVEHVDPSKIVVIPNADHFVFVSNRDEVLREVDAFIGALPGP